MEWAKEHVGRGVAAGKRGVEAQRSTGSADDRTWSSSGSTHSVFNEPFAALALNLLIELEPAAGCRM